MKTRLFLVYHPGKNKAVLISLLIYMTYVCNTLVLVDGLINGSLMKVVTMSGELYKNIWNINILKRREYDKRLISRI